MEAPRLEELRGLGGPLAYARGCLRPHCSAPLSRESESNSGVDTRTNQFSKTKRLWTCVRLCLDTERLFVARSLRLSSRRGALFRCRRVTCQPLFSRRCVSASTALRGRRRLSSAGVSILVRFALPSRVLFDSSLARGRLVLAELLTGSAPCRTRYRGCRAAGCGPVSGWNLKDRASLARVRAAFSVSGGGHSSRRFEPVKSFFLSPLAHAGGVRSDDEAMPRRSACAPVENLLKELPAWEPRGVRSPSITRVALLSPCECRRCESTVEPLPRASLSRRVAPSRADPGGVCGRRFERRRMQAT